MAVLVTAEMVQAAMKQGRLMLLKRVNAPGNVGKTPELVMAELLTVQLNPPPEPPAIAVGDDPLLRRLREHGP